MMAKLGACLLLTACVMFIGESQSFFIHQRRDAEEYQKDARQLCRVVLARYDQCKKLEMKEKFPERQIRESEDRTLEKYKRAIKVLARLASQLKREKTKSQDMEERGIDDLSRMARF